MTVLIIDDDESSRIIARLVLETLGGMEVIEADSGVSGVEQALRYVPDGILLDMLMPGMNGAETLELLRRHGTTAGIPVVILSGMWSTDDQAMFQRLGAAGFIRKPIDTVHFAAEIRFLLSVH